MSAFIDGSVPCANLAGNSSRTAAVGPGPTQLDVTPLVLVLLRGTP